MIDLPCYFIDGNLYDTHKMNIVGKWIDTNLYFADNGNYLLEYEDSQTQSIKTSVISAEKAKKLMLQNKNYAECENHFGKTSQICTDTMHDESCDRKQDVMCGHPEIVAQKISKICDHINSISQKLMEIAETSYKIQQSLKIVQEALHKQEYVVCDRK